MAILVAADFGAGERAAWESALQAALPDDRFVHDRNDGPADDIEIALVANPAPGSLRELPRLRLIQSLWAGVDRLLADATMPPQLPLARMVDPAMNAAMAQTALWATLGLHRGFFDYALQQRARQWRQHALQRAEDVHVAVLGLGQMGGCTARVLARQGYRVTGWSRGETRVEGVLTQAGDAALPDVLASAEIVVNLLPLTPATSGFFNAARLAQMPRGASLVNLARGAHVVDADLLDALDRGHIAHAVLDVFEIEPLPPDHPFWSHPRVTVLPHIAAPTDPRSAARVVAGNVQALREGRPLAHLVDRRRGY